MIVVCSVKAFLKPSLVSTCTVTEADPSWKAAPVSLSTSTSQGRAVAPHKGASRKPLPLATNAPTRWLTVTNISATEGVVQRREPVAKSRPDTAPVSAVSTLTVVEARRGGYSVRALRPPALELLQQA